KKLVYVVLLFLAAGVVEFTGAQTDSNSVNIQLWINCRNTASAQLFSASIKEGETYTVPATTLSAAYASAQPLYDAFVGTEFSIEYGALTEDVDIFWFIWDVDCNTGNFFPAGGGSLFMNSMFQVSVGGTPVSGTYNFANGKKAVLSIPKSPAFQAFLAANGFTTSNILTFAYQLADGSIDTTGIMTGETATHMYAFASHFSNIVGGDRSILTGVKEDVISSQPTEFALSQNYPNPFNPSTSFEYSLAENSFVTVRVFDILGREVATLVNSNKDAGKYRLDFDASNLPSGLYIYELRTENFVQTRKMMLMK
ncbi:MAG: T9SS type A sorting domain-containing protein, partial [Ignavibacteriaceae bacterium]|nr:T9SS type A sorting domain-containing protein [Ignavibacteriaceae bacterium]